MNLGSQATIAGADPPNLCHLEFSNGMHPIQSQDKFDFAVIDLGRGYRAAANCAEADGLGAALDRLFARWGHSCCLWRSFRAKVFRENTAIS